MGNPGIFFAILWEVGEILVVWYMDASENSDTPKSSFIGDTVEIHLQMVGFYIVMLVYLQSYPPRNYPAKTNMTRWKIHHE